MKSTRHDETEVSVGILATVFCFSVRAQTVNVMTLDQARTAARLQRPTAEIEDNINRGRTAFVTAGIAALRGGMPIRVSSAVMGAVGVAGLSKETDAEIANTAATALSSSPMRAQRR
jgi:glc operon protein GlcG